MLRRPLALFVAALFLGAPASAEIYRWTDESGKEHFTTNLNQVPPQYRPGARDTAVQQKTKPVVVESDHPMQPTRSRFPAAKTPPRRPQGRQQVPSREVQMGSHECSRAQAKARSLQRSIDSAERQVESYEDAANDTALSDRSRRRYEVRLENAEGRLERAEEQLQDYVQSKRRAGLPFGCLR